VRSKGVLQLPDYVPGAPEDSYPDVKTIENEYRRLDEKWLSLHYQANLWVVFCATILELLMFFVLESLRQILLTPAGYFLKYLLVPFSLNLFFLAVTHHAIKSPRCSEKCRVYAVSVSVMLCCFVIYTVHSVFPALYLIFAIPMILTVIYGDRRLTSVITGLCIGGKMLADFLLYRYSGRDFVLSTPLDAVNFYLSLVILGGLYVICLLLIRIERAKNNVGIELELERLRLCKTAMTDALTGIGNRQALRKAFSEMEDTPRRRYMLVMIDIDHFKDLNDSHGHTCGDSYLTAFGAVLREMCAENGQPFRFGGDEFCILLQGVIPEYVRNFCLKLQSRFQEEQKKLQGSGSTTLSIGVADYRFGEQPYELLQRADAALYRAKQERDRICFATFE
jgi:diguanylate cyclase